MNTKELKNSVYARLETIANAEKITKAEMVPMAEELLQYVPETDDIDVVNRLFVVLNPATRASAIVFFRHFLPWKSEEDKDGKFNRFGKRMDGNRAVETRMKRIAEFLADKDATFWNWVDDNVEVKQKNFGATVSNAVKKALKGDEKSNTPALTPHEVLVAMFDGGITLEDMVAEMASRVESVNEAAKVVEQVHVEKDMEPVAKAA